MPLHRRQITEKVKAPFVNPQLTLHFDYIESEQGKTEWFAGPEFTATDVQACPAYQCALAQGGPYDYA